MKEFFFCLLRSWRCTFHCFVPLVLFSKVDRHAAVPSEEEENLHTTSYRSIRLSCLSTSRCQVACLLFSSLIFYISFLSVCFPWLRVTDIDSTEAREGDFSLLPFSSLLLTPRKQENNTQRAETKQRKRKIGEERKNTERGRQIDRSRGGGGRVGEHPPSLLYDR